jgi:meso-butanediol dehydrogenase / (S,S)-butanediol dehydrogenase / diacetyl reductase
MERFKGKTVIVTGAASGIGEATARRFSSEGANVALVDQNREALAQMWQACLPIIRSHTLRRCL